MRVVITVLVLTACGGESPPTEDPFCLGGDKVEFSGMELKSWCSCEIGKRVEIKCEYTEDMSGFVAWTRRFVGMSVDQTTLAGELLLWESDPVGSSLPTHIPTVFSGQVGGMDACFETRIGVAGSTEPAVVRVHVNQCQ